jgi:hypothetical protein
MSTDTAIASRDYAGHAFHRFDDFRGDFSAWVMFYGPEGGEAALTSA